MARSYDYGKLGGACLLDLRLAEGTGGAAVRTLDWAKPHHNVTLVTAVTWATVAASGLTVLDFNPATPDRLICLAAGCTDLGFTAGAFAAVVWIKPDAYGNRWLMMKGAAETGWGFWIAAASPYIYFTTEQAGPTYQHTLGAAALATGAWQLVGFSRSGAAARVYLNGLDATATAGTHVNPAASAAGDFSIGTTVGGGAGFYDGQMARPRIWGDFLTADEHWAIFERERYLFGV